MQPKPIKRRHFLGYVLFLFALYRCKKDSLLKKPGSTVGVPLPPVVSDDFMGQYTITEVGSNLQPEPDYMSTINGYTDKASYLPGENLTLYLSGPASDNASIPVWDMNNKTVLSVIAPLTTQTIKSDKPWVDGFMYDKTLEIKLPSDMKSGIYTWPGKVPFVCKGTGSSYDITVVYPSNTLNAYNFAGGKSLYAPDYHNRATVASYLRSNILYYQVFYLWLGKQNYTVNYIADCDVDDYSNIENSKVVILTGHSEYWTRKARLNIDKFVDSGRNLLMLSGNNMWWQVRYNQSKNLMICYKNNTGGYDDDNSSDPLVNTIYSTVNWGSPSVNYSIVKSTGSDFRYGGYGQMLTDRWNGYKILQENSPILKGTGLKNGDILHIPSTEYDGSPVMKFYPPGSTEIPVIDNSIANFHKVELLGYDYARDTSQAYGLGYGTFIVNKKSPTSGTIVNAASMDWCYYIIDSEIQIVTKNMIDLSLNNESLFTS